MKIYLASGSPRRRELLEQAGIEYTVVVSGAEENTSCTKPADVVEELSCIKAEAVAGEIRDKDDYCVIGADTVVAYEGSIMGKPADEEDAERMLRMLSGNTHQVYTGVTLAAVINGQRRKVTFHERTDVTMYELSDREIRDYILTGEPMDKAGAYGIQGRAGIFVKEISGDYCNVVGLPIARLYHELCKLQSI